MTTKVWFYNQFLLVQRGNQSLDCTLKTELRVLSINIIG